MEEISQNPEVLKDNDLSINALVVSVTQQTYIGNKHLLSEIHSFFEMRQFPKLDTTKLVIILSCFLQQ